MKKLIKISVLAIFLLLFIQLVSAIGMSPAKKNIDFEANKKIDFSFNIVNNEKKDFTAIVYARGELEKFITIKNPVITFSSSDDRKEAQFVLDIPESIGKPGTHTTEIVVIEYPSQITSAQDTASVQALGSVAAKLNVLVPFPGKYAEAQLYITSASPGEYVQFKIPVFNYGKEDIRKVKASLQILGATYEKIGEFDTEEAAIASQGQLSLTASWKADVNPGKYHAKAVLYYDDEKLELENNFEVGSMLIEIVKIENEQFSLGQVAKFDITLENKWSEQINDVYADMTVSDKKGTTYGTFKTASVNIPALSREKVAAFWDTKGIAIGLYDLKLAVHYSGKVTEKLIETEVNIDSIRTSLGPTAKVVAGKSSSRDAILMILVIALVIINIGWFIHFRRSKK